MHSVITTQAFATAWVQVNTVAHQALVQILSGQGGGAISTSNGQIVLNLGPLIAVAKQDLVAHGFKLASSIPPVTPTLALFQAKDLGKAQSQYRLLKTLKIVLPILALLLIGAGVFVARGRLGVPWSEPGSAWPRPCWSWPSAWRSPVVSTSVASPPTCCPVMPRPPCSTRLSTSSSRGSGSCWRSGWSSPSARPSTGPSHTAVQTRSALTSGIDWIRHYGERRGVSTGPFGHWAYLHRRSLRVGVVALFALIFVFWAQPTALVVILLVILLLVVLGLIELIGRPPAEPHAAGQAVS